MRSMEATVTIGNTVTLVIYSSADQDLDPKNDKDKLMLEPGEKLFSLLAGLGLGVNTFRIINVAISIAVNRRSFMQ